MEERKLTQLFWLCLWHCCNFFYLYSYLVIEKCVTLISCIRNKNLLTYFTLDEHLTWPPQISHVQMKLNQAIRILSKLRYQANIQVLKKVYHSLFGTHLLYACQLWGQNNKETQNKIRTLQNRALKK